MQDKTEQELSQKLVNLGLTRQEADLYLLLQHQGALTAKEVSKRMQILPNAVYRAAKSLENKKLINILEVTPALFKAVPSSVGLPLYVKERSFALQSGLDRVTDLMNRARKGSEATRLELISGKYQTYMTGTDMLNRAKKEFLVISIGEEVPEELLLAVNKAHKRGVICRLIVHKYDQENKQILDNFKKNGYEIRHYPDWGFHLTISDGREALLIVNNPSDPRERVGIQIYSPGLAKALRDYFYSVWDKAQEV